MSKVKEVINYITLLKNYFKCKIIKMSCKSVCTKTVLFLLLLLLPGCLCLRDAKMIIPEAVERGRLVVIKCLYDLENEDLYQVRWYKGDRELCRYAPREVPPLKIFPIKGLEVDLERSNAKQLTISTATRAAQGQYTCEVSTDTPSFLTLQLRGFMYVVDLPRSFPALLWTKQSYKPGMKMKAECISYDSMPPANLSFFINNQPALSQHVWHKIRGGTNGSLWTAHSTLQFVIQEQHFINFKIRIRCEATIYSIYHKSQELVAEAERTSTTIAPITRIQDTTLSKCENSGSSNRNVLWTMFEVTFLVFGLHFGR